MIINQQALHGMYTNFKAVFNEAFKNTVTHWEKVATKVPSVTREENYKWLGQLPRMREWIGDREVQNLGAFDYTIKSKDFELTVGVERNDIEDDAMGLYTPIMQDLAYNTATFPDEMVFGLLKEGFTNLCYDGEPFFSENHRIGKRTISNKSSQKLTATSYAAARQAMMGLVNEQGRSLKLMPNLLVVAPANEPAARKVLKADLIDGSTNIYKDSAELLVLPDLAGADDAWYLLCTTRPLKPLIYQVRKEPEFVSLTSEKDQNVFMKKQFLYGVDGRSNAGYGFWHMAFGSDGTQAD